MTHTQETIWTPSALADSWAWDSVPAWVLEEQYRNERPDVAARIDAEQAAALDARFARAAY